MPLFIPSMVAHLTLKFDEALHIQNESVGLSVDQLVKTSGAIPGARKLITGQHSSFISNRVPKAASVELPGIRQAGNFNLTLDFSELPIDPRTIRAAAIDIHLGTIDSEAFARGVSQPARYGRTSESILETRNVLDVGASDTLLIKAVVDEWEVSHGPEGSLVTMSGRDLRGVLLDTPVCSDPKGTAQLLDQLDLSQPIDQLCKQILSYHPTFKRINPADGWFSIMCNPLEWTDSKIPSPGGAAVVPRHKQGAKGKKKGGNVALPGDSINMNFWDLIVQFCYFVGAAPVLHGSNLIIRPVRRLYDQQNGGVDPTIRTPFKDGAQRVTDTQSGASISPLSVRRLVYGRDIDEMSLNRKFSGYQRPRRVRVHTHNPSADTKEAQIVTCWWPPQDLEGPKQTQQQVNAEKAHEEVLNIPVPGITDPKRLIEIAKSIYEEIGRGELGGHVTTKNLSSFGGDNTDPDLLRLRPGDAVELGVDTRSIGKGSPLVSELTDHFRMPAQERVAQLTAILGDENLANVIVATSRGTVQQLQSFFRVSNTKYSWDAKSGVKISFDFQNYVEARFKADADKTAPPIAMKRTIV